MAELPGFCGVCGWPLAASSCEACGASVGEAPVGEDYTDVSLVGGARPEDYPELKNAFHAWQQKDWTRMIGQCLVSLGIGGPQITQLAVGQGWAFVQDSAVIYLSTDRDRGEIAIESPIVRVPARLRIPLFRTLLELNDHALGAARFCLRGDLVVLRFADRLVNVSPPKLVAAIREMALRADWLDDLLALTFSARMVGPEAQRRHLAWTFLGTPRRLANLRGADLPPVALPPPAEEAAAALSLGSPPLPHEAGLAARIQAADGLCELLRSAQTLLKPFLFMLEASPAPPLLLQRALLFRVYEEFRDGCPDAVALLMRIGSPLSAQLWDTGLIEKRRGGGFGIADTPSVHLLSGVLAEVIRSRAEVGRQEPRVPELFKSAAEIKDLFRRYLDEIEKGPQYPAFRHFLLLGAFAELLHRTRLAPATAERFREVMAEGKRRGAKAEGVFYLAEALRGVIA